jgi:two-component system response regulator AtoC
MLMRHSWPGNVRELENAVKRAAILAEGPILSPEDFPFLMAEPAELPGLPDAFNGYSLKKAQRVLEKHLITKALEKTGGNRTKATRLLGISHPSLLTKMRAYDIRL